jgi:sugar (pentulose or hexulose) kinase
MDAVVTLARTYEPDGHRHDLYSERFQQYIDAYEALVPWFIKWSS